MNQNKLIFYKKRQIVMPVDMRHLYKKRDIL